MKRFLVSAAVFALSLLASSLLLAQSNPQVGTWKLDISKSQFVNEDPPKSATRIVEAQSDGAKVSLDGIAPNGNRFAYSYTTNYDGKESPISGIGARADTIAVKRIDANITLATAKQAFNVAYTLRVVVSKDGTVTTITANGTNEIAEPVSAMTVWEKQ